MNALLICDAAALGAVSIFAILVALSVTHVRDRGVDHARLDAAIGRGLEGASHDAPPQVWADLMLPVSTTLIIGWRAWRLDWQDAQLVLKSVVVESCWPWGTALEARDLPPPGGSAHGPGIYATKTRWGTRAVMADWKTDVYGTVALWGEVAVHQRGYRAQYAYPKFVWCRTEAVAQELRRLYGCETDVARPWLRRRPRLRW